MLPVIAVTGTSGAGKGTLERAVMPRLPELELAISATTRARRHGENHGREYYFVSDAEFQRMLDAGEFLEHVDFEWGQRVGTLWSEIGRIRAEGKAPLLDLETDGALAVQREIEDSVTIFVRAPTFAELVVVVVDLAGSLRSDDHERVARVDGGEELIDAWMDHCRDMLPAACNSRWTISRSSSAARATSSLTIT